MIHQAGILIIDDNLSVLKSLNYFLKRKFSHIETVNNPNRALDLLAEYEFDVVLLDMNFSKGTQTGKEGMYWMRQIKDKYPDIVLFLITAYGDIELAVNAIKEGAFDYIVKPWDNNKLYSSILAALQLRNSNKHIKDLTQREENLKQQINRENIGIIGESEAMKEILNTVKKVAVTDANVLILGENGTGKELIARAIHRYSPRNQEVFLGIDLGSISESLFESEIFGHEKGAFTDAKERRTGKMEAANKGSIFLDEIGNLSYTMQAKLLRVLQEKKICRIGSNKDISLDLRIISATNKDMKNLIDENLFREDLLYRINTIQIELPPLRERGNDIILLADFYLEKLSTKYGKPGLKLSGKAHEALLHYCWPGNVRELKHSIEKAVILSEKNIINQEAFAFNSVHKEKEYNNLENMSLEEAEKIIISNALKRNQGNMSETARSLKIGRQTLYRKIEKYEL